jgi:hypothetical protein
MRIMSSFKRFVFCIIFTFLGLPITYFAKNKKLKIIYFLLGITMTAHAGSEIEAIKLLQNELNVTGPLKTELLSGGFSGSKIIKVHSLEQDYVVRFWNKQWEEDFPQDLAGQLVGSEAGYGPKVFFTDMKDCVSIMEYCRPEAYPTMPTRLKALVDLVKKIHLGPKFPKGLDRSQYLDELIASVKELNPQFLDLSYLTSIKDAVYTAFKNDPLIVPCHRDLHPGNLIYTQGRFIAIDYTWVDMEYPYTDLAILATFNCVTLEEEEYLLELYLERKPTLIERAKLSLMKLPVKIFYGLELLKKSPLIALNEKAPKVMPKSYMNFGRHGEAELRPEVFFEYAVSILHEVITYAGNDQFEKDLALLNN